MRWGRIGVLWAQWMDYNIDEQKRESDRWFSQIRFHPIWLNLIWKIWLQIRLLFQRCRWIEWNFLIHFQLKQKNSTENVKYSFYVCMSVGFFVCCFLSISFHTIMVSPCLTLYGQSDQFPTGALFWVGTQLYSVALLALFTSFWWKNI